jgi:hypothetical protein
MILKTARRLVILVIGITIGLFGVILLFTPGPGTVFLLAGIGVLATEFVWARHLLKKVKEQAIQAGNSVGLNWGSNSKAKEKA